MEEYCCDREFGAQTYRSTTKTKRQGQEGGRGAGNDASDNQSTRKAIDKTGDEIQLLIVGLMTVRQAFTSLFFLSSTTYDDPKALVWSYRIQTAWVVWLYLDSDCLARGFGPWLGGLGPGLDHGLDQDLDQGSSTLAGCLQSVRMENVRAGKSNCLRLFLNSKANSNMDRFSRIALSICARYNKCHITCLDMSRHVSFSRSFQYSHLTHPVPADQAIAYNSSFTHFPSPGFSTTFSSPRSFNPRFTMLVTIS
jgi:hypothetical protein